MIGISKLCCGAQAASDGLRCVHCYTDSEARAYAGELSTEEGVRLLDDLAAFQVPAVLFSGGEGFPSPLVRQEEAHA